MQLLTIVIIAALVMGVAYGINLLLKQLNASVDEFGRNVQAKYQYDVLSLSNIFIGVSPSILILLGLILDQNADSTQNLLAAISVAIALIIGQYYFLAKKTDKQIALISVTILQVLGFLLVVVFLVSFIVTFVVTALLEKSRQDSYGDEENF